MKKEVLGKCPVCGEELYVTELSCHKCHTHIRGDFILCRFCRLTDEQKSFAEVFIKNRGNIKEIEKELGISYPTVRGKLEDIIGAMGYSPKLEETGADKKEILKRLADGEITPEEALRFLQGGK
ncbi:MAG TPA: DUF2089 domain-containing protein [Clostridia bacterium]|nr:DUF2089 domain-containing protein [Clostridia bacterium]